MQNSTLYALEIAAGVNPNLVGQSDDPMEIDSHYAVEFDHSKICLNILNEMLHFGTNVMIEEDWNILEKHGWSPVYDMDRLNSNDMLAERSRKGKAAPENCRNQYRVKSGDEDKNEDEESISDEPSSAEEPDQLYLNEMNWLDIIHECCPKCSCPYYKTEYLDGTLSKAYNVDKLEDKRCFIRHVQSYCDSDVCKKHKKYSNFDPNNEDGLSEDEIQIMRICKVCNCRDCGERKLPNQECPSAHVTS